MPMAPISNSLFWRDLAEAALAHAEQMADEKSKLILCEIVDAYQRLAKRAEELRDLETRKEDYVGLRLKIRAK
jgi:hypothetical protein